MIGTMRQAQPKLRGNPSLCESHCPMRMILALFALGAGAYALSRRSAGSGTHPRAAFGQGQPGHGRNPVRDAGPEAMRDPPKEEWTDVDEASDQSFPASDPPATY